MTKGNYYLKLFSENKAALAGAISLLERFATPESIESGKEFLQQQVEKLNEEVPISQIKEVFPDYDENTEDNGIRHLLFLMQTHPNLPVVPMVDSEVCAGDGYAWWMGDWGSSRIDKFIIPDEKVLFYDEQDYESTLIDAIGYERYMALDDDKVLETYRNLNWTEAIIVSIGTI